MPKQADITKFFAKSPKVVNKKGSENVAMNSQVDPDTRLPDRDAGETPASKKPKTADEASLTPEQKSRMQLNKIRGQMVLLSKKFPAAFDADMGRTWFQALEPEFQKDYFSKLNQFIQAQRSKSTVYPTPGNVWSWTKHFEISKTKVVILGQDPYHGPNQAHGLCFSVQKGVSPPPSLLNMFKELEADIAGFKRPDHGDLTGWAAQGVLLLNACLTVTRSQANSHKDQGWEKVTDAVIKYINNNTRGVIFLLWGSFAQKKASFVDGKKHHLLKTVHPSPLSAHRGFFGCKHFSKCNDLLIKGGKNPIDWNKLD